MTAPSFPRRFTPIVALQSLLWLWVVSLSVFVILSYQALSNQADQERTNNRLNHVDAQVVDLAESIQTLQQRPVAATAAALEDTRQTLEAHILQVEQVLSDYAMADDLQALRAKVEKIATRQKTAPTIAPTQPSVPSKPATTSKPKTPPLSFRIVSSELRAGRRSVSVVSTGADIAPDQIQVLLPGDSVGRWRLQAIEENAAVFKAGNQTRRVMIP